MPRRPAELPLDLPSPVFFRHELLSAGIDEHRLRRADLHALGAGAYVRRSALHNLRELDIVAAIRRNDPEAFAIDLTAARLWGFPLPSNVPPWRPGNPVAMATTLPVHRPNTPLVTWSRRRIAQDSIVDSGGVHTTSMARTWRDLAPLLGHLPGVVIGDHLVRQPRARLEGRREPYASIAELDQLCQQRPRGPGVSHARQVLHDVRVGADSPMETALRLACVRDGLPEPLLNEPIRVDGTEHHTPDAQWPEFGVALEYDGRGHLTPEQRDRDIRRAERIRKIGWVEVIVTAADMSRRAQRAVGRVRDVLHSRGWIPR